MFYGLASVTDTEGFEIEQHRVAGDGYGPMVVVRKDGLTLDNVTSPFGHLDHRAARAAAVSAGAGLSVLRSIRSWKPCATARRRRAC